MILTSTGVIGRHCFPASRLAVGGESELDPGLICSGGRRQYAGIRAFAHLNNFLESLAGFQKSSHHRVGSLVLHFAVHRYEFIPRFQAHSVCNSAISAIKVPVFERRNKLGRSRCSCPWFEIDRLKVAQRGWFSAALPGADKFKAACWNLGDGALEFLTFGFSRGRRRRPPDFRRSSWRAILSGSFRHWVTPC